VTPQEKVEGIVRDVLQLRIDAWQAELQKLSKVDARKAELQALIAEAQKFLPAEPVPAPVEG